MILRWLKDMLNKMKYGKINSLINEDQYNSIPENKIFEWKENIYGEWFREYKKIFERIQHTNNQFERDLNTQISNPLMDYEGWVYQRINYYLRYGKFVDNCSSEREHILIDISLLRWAIYSSPTIPNNIIVYRRIPEEIASEIVENNKNFEEKGPFQEKGFMSTSLSKRMGSDYPYHYVLKIYVSENSYAVCADMEEEGESELIFPPNCYLQLIDYPFRDDEDTVIPCKLIQFK